MSISQKSKGVFFSPSCLQVPKSNWFSLRGIAEPYSEVKTNYASLALFIFNFETTAGFFVQNQFTELMLGAKVEAEAVTACTLNWDSTQFKDSHFMHLNAKGLATWANPNSTLQHLKGSGGTVLFVRSLFSFTVDKIAQNGKVFQSSTYDLKSGKIAYLFLN